jgi:hypothetical protein
MGIHASYFRGDTGYASVDKFKWSKPARAWSIGFELAQIGRRGRATKADFLPL